MAVRSKGVAATESTKCKPSAAHGAMNFECFDRVRRTGGEVPAGRRTVGPHGANCLDQPDQAASTSAGSCTWLINTRLINTRPINTRPINTGMFHVGVIGGRVEHQPALLGGVSRATRVDRALDVGFFAGGAAFGWDPASGPATPERWAASSNFMS